MKSIRTIEDKYLGKDVYVMAAGKSLDYIDDSFFDNKVLIGVNKTYKRYRNCVYSVIHNHVFVQEAINYGRDVITSEYDCCDKERDKHNFIGEYRMFWHAQQNHTGEVDLEVFDKHDHLACCSATVGTAIHFAYYIGAKNIIVCGMDSLGINDKYYYDGYYKDNKYAQHVNHCRVTHKPVLDIVNEIRRRGVNVVGFNPFINMLFEGKLVR